MKKKWNLLVMLLVLVVGGVLAGCGNGSGGNVDIGIVLPTKDEPRWVQDEQRFKDALKDSDYTTEILFSQGSSAKEKENVEALLNKGIKVLIITPHDAAAAAAAVEAAKKDDVTVISYDRIVKNADIDLYISFDNERVGQLQAEELLKNVPQGNVVYIGGASTDHNSHLLKKGAMNVLAPLIRSGDIRIQYDQWTKNWQPKEAAKGMEEALRINHPQIDAVIAANDATAYAAMQVIKQQGMTKKIAVIGQDADAVNIQAIQQGTQLATVYKPVKKLSSVAAKTAVSMAKKQKVDITDSIDNGKNNIPSILLEPILVTKKNIQNTVVKDGFYQEDK